jgi:hypothetical protein
LRQAVAAMATVMAAMAAMATAMVAMATATVAVAVAVAATATSMAWMVTAMAAVAMMAMAVAAMATATVAVTTINSKEVVTAAAEELGNGRDGRWLCSVFFVIPISSHPHRHRHWIPRQRRGLCLKVHPGLAVFVAILDLLSSLSALFLSFSVAFILPVAVSVAVTVAAAVISSAGSFS